MGARPTLPWPAYNQVQPPVISTAFQYCHQIMNQLTDYSIREVRAHNTHPLPQGPTSGPLLASRTKPSIHMAFRGALNFQAVNWPTHRIFRTSNKLHPFPSLTFLSGSDLCCLWDMHWKIAGLSHSLVSALNRQLAFLWGSSDPRTIWSVHFIPCRTYCMKLTDVV